LRKLEIIFISNYHSSQPRWTERWFNN
jgi:hypothetical protein